MNDRFIIPSGMRTASMVLMLIGVLTLICGGIFLLGYNSADVEVTHAMHTRFWIGLLHNSIFFAFLTVISVFIQAAVQLAQGAWLVAYRRVPEAIGANVWLFGGISVLIGLLVVLVYNPGGHNPIYHWVHPEGDAILMGKKAFLNPAMYAGFTIITVALWAYFGRKFRSSSLAQDAAPRNSTKLYWKRVTLSGLFLLVFALTMMSTSPWMFIMSIDSHWFSTMFSWYTFSSVLVSGLGVVLLFTVYLRNQGNLELVTKEHIHDLGKFQFAFSILWTYLWFSQFMLIWYGNLPEETIYFQWRMHGPYSVIWFAVLIINFVAPILILMSRPSKRNYFTVCFMAMLIIFGHWLDFYQMMYPGTMGTHFTINWYELGILAGFSGLLIFSVSRTLAAAPVTPTNDPMLKEAIVHLS